MSVRKSDDFLGDVEPQFEWHALNANWEIAEQYLSAVEATCQLLGQHPRIGPLGRFTHARLRQWRVFLVFRPFNKHIVFYETSGEDIVLRRVMHGRRDLPRRLLQPPGST